KAIRKLETREIDVIFTVDLFNEGVDIPSVDTLLFARPTESIVVFTQQIGRGLRKYDCKDTCVIIDLIRNDHNTDTKLQIFEQTSKDQIAKRHKNVVPVVHDACEIRFETEVIKLLLALRLIRSPRKERIRLDYFIVQET